MKANRICSASKVLAASVLACWAGAAVAGTEGSSSTFYGAGAGFSADGDSGNNSFFGVSAGQGTTTGTANTFLGASAGAATLNGIFNTYVGTSAGLSNTAGLGHTYLGAGAGSNSFGSERNVFLGYGAGMNNSGSHQLVIDNCVYSSVPNACDQPLILGDFQNRILELNGILGVTADRHSGLVKSQLHFSVNGADEGGWLTSAGENNFFTSSGARYDANAGGWIQRSSDGKAVIAGSGAAGFRVLTSSGTAVDGVAVPISRLHINYDGLMGVNAAPVAGRAINTATGAYLSSGGVWTNASSRALKADIAELPADRALAAFRELRPVTFRYTNESAGHVGFIAEDVPALVATEDRKGLSAMDVVAVLTKVVQRQDAELEQMKAQLREMAARLSGR